ncbi:MAG: inorganic diphosphatase [Patescibacteria group bacterium]
MARRELVVEAVIEIPKGTQNKYEHDQEKGGFRLDRVLYSPVHYPADYGFIPETLAEDGDPLDIMVMISSPTFPGCLVPARVIGALTMEDDKGIDTKLVAAAAVDPRYDRVQEVRHLSPHSIREMEYFFGIYKDLEGKKSVVTGWRDLEFARAALEKAREAWRAARKKTSARRSLRRNELRRLKNETPPR